MAQGSDFSSPMAHQGKPAPQKAPGTSGKAIASLILGFLSIIGMCLTGIPGLILGIMGLSDIGKSGGRTTGKGIAIGGIVLSSLGIAWTVIAILIGMLLPAVQQVRGAARQVVAQNNVRQQLLGMLNYESANQRFPPQEQNGLSWRVYILPYLGHEQLFDQFKLDQPWDSPHNIALLPQMPEIYACPDAPELPAGFTIYQVPYSDVQSGADNINMALFDNSGRKIRLTSVQDGLSKTIAIVEVNPSAAVEWTKPADWKYDSSDLSHDLGDLRARGIVVGMGDASTAILPSDISPADLEALITRNGGEEISPFVLK